MRDGNKLIGDLTVMMELLNKNFQCVFTKESAFNEPVVVKQQMDHITVTEEDIHKKRNRRNESSRTTTM